jgi:hypothetical protein
MSMHAAAHFAGSVNGLVKCLHAVQQTQHDAKKCEEVVSTWH